MKLHIRIATLSIVCVGFLLACLVAEWIPKFEFWPLILLGFIISLVFAWPSNKVRICIIGLITFFVAIIYWQHSYKVWNVYVPAGQVAEIDGWLTGLPQSQSDGERVVLAVESIKYGNNQQEQIKGMNLAVYFSSPTQLKYGDEVKFQAKFERLPMYEGFNGVRYWRAKGVQAQVHIKEWKKISSEKHGNSLTSKLLQLKTYIASRVKSEISGPEGVLLLGILFGDQGQIPKAISAQFKVLGISHITAVSGYNLTIIALWPVALAGLIPKRWALILAAIFVLIFVIFTGAPSSIIRAAIMAWGLLFGKYLGRSPQTLLLILLTAMLMAIDNPFVVKDDAGFILSFLAFFGLVEIGPYIARYLKVLRNPGLIVIASETFGAQIATLPYLIGAFGQFSLIAPIANFIILPLMPLITLVGLTSVIIATIPIVFLAKLVGLMFFPLHGFLWIINKMSNIPYISVPWPKGSQFSWYLAMIVFVWWVWMKISEGFELRDKSHELRMGK